MCSRTGLRGASDFVGHICFKVNSPYQFSARYKAWCGSLISRNPVIRKYRSFYMKFLFYSSLSSSSSSSFYFCSSALPSSGCPSAAVLMPLLLLLLFLLEVLPLSDLSKLVLLLLLLPLPPRMAIPPTEAFRVRGRVYSNSVLWFLIAGASARTFFACDCPRDALGFLYGPLCPTHFLDPVVVYCCVTYIYKLHKTCNIYCIAETNCKHLQTVFETVVLVIQYICWTIRGSNESAGT